MGIEIVQWCLLQCVHLGNNLECPYFKKYLEYTYYIDIYIFFFSIQNFQPFRGQVDIHLRNNPLFCLNQQFLKCGTPGRQEALTRACISRSSSYFSVLLNSHQPLQLQYFSVSFSLSCILIIIYCLVLSFSHLIFFNLDFILLEKRVFNKFQSTSFHRTLF